MRQKAVRAERVGCAITGPSRDCCALLDAVETQCETPIIGTAQVRSRRPDSSSTPAQSSNSRSLITPSRSRARVRARALGMRGRWIERMPGIGAATMRPAMTCSSSTVRGAGSYCHSGRRSDPESSLPGHLLATTPAEVRQSPARPIAIKSSAWALRSVDRGSTSWNLSRLIPLCHLTEQVRVVPPQPLICAPGRRGLKAINHIFIQEHRSRRRRA